MVGRVVDVRPVDERRDAGVDALERPGQVARVDVLRAGRAARSCRAPPRSSRRASRSGRSCGSPSPTCADACRRSRGSRCCPETVDDLGVGRSGPSRPARSCRPRSGRRPPRCSRACGSTVSTCPPRSKIRSAIASPPLDLIATARRTPSTIRSTDGIAQVLQDVRRPATAGAAWSPARSARRTRRTPRPPRSTRPRLPTRTVAGSPRP